MAFKVNKIDPVKQEVEFDITREELNPHFEKAYQKYRNKANIPGFRKGKAPLQMIKKMFGEAIEYGSLEDIANDIFKGYINDNHVHTLGPGSITDMDFKPEALKFKIQYEVKPEIELKNYKGIEAVKPIYEVNDDVVNSEIEYQRGKFFTYEPAEKAEGDKYVITLDIQKMDANNFPVIGNTDKGVKIYLADKELNPGLKEQLTGITQDEERIIKLKNENDEKEEPYKIKAVKVEKVVLPEMNSEFFGKVSKEPADDEASFREAIKKDLVRIYEDISQRQLRSNIMSELIRQNDIPVPESLVDNVLTSYLEDIKKRNPKREFPEGFDTEEFKKQRRVDAVLNVKSYLIKEKIAELENLKAEESDIEKLSEEDSKKYNMPADKLKKIYEANHDVHHRILDNKVIDFLTANAKIKEEKQSPESQINE